MDIHSYNVISKVNDKNKPFVDNRGRLVVKCGVHNYKYYLECNRIEVNETTNESTVVYYILLSNKKFNPACKRLINDNYGRIVIRINDAIRNYINKISVYKDVECYFSDMTVDYDCMTII